MARTFTITEKQMHQAMERMDDRGYYTPSFSLAYYDREAKEYTTKQEIPYTAKYYEYIDQKGVSHEEIRVRVSNKGAVTFQRDSDGLLSALPFDVNKIKKINRKYEADSASFKLTTSASDYEATIEFLTKHWGFGTMKFDTLVSKCR